jgi:hypothetical protein
MKCTSATMKSLLTIHFLFFRLTVTKAKENSIKHK